MAKRFKKLIVFAFITCIIPNGICNNTDSPSAAKANTASKPEVNVTLIKLTPFTPPHTILITGKVVPIEKQTLKFEDFGKIQTILDEGADVKGNIMKKDGSVHEQGTLIANQHTDVDKANFKSAQAAIEKANVALKKAKDDLLRNKKLVGSHAISQKAFEASEVAYLQAKSNLNEAYQSLTKASFQLSSDYMYSSFDAIVNKVYQSPDIWYEGFHNTATIQMMNPIAIKIPIEYISDINHLSEKPIIYSPNSNTRIADWICDYTQLENDKYFHYFVVPNEKITFYNNLPKKYKQLPKIGWACKLIYFDNTQKELAVPLDSILVENNKEFVWILKENFSIDKDNVVNYRTYTANKVQIETGDKIKNIGIYKIIEVTNANGLKIHDTIMWDKPPKNLKDGDIVLLDPKKWKLAPGDEIKVLVNLIPMKKGFYVPIDAITLNQKGETFVTLANGKMVKINVERGFANLKMISGPELKEGTLIRQNPNNIDAILDAYCKAITKE